MGDRGGKKNKDKRQKQKARKLADNLKEKKEKDSKGVTK